MKRLEVIVQPQQRVFKNLLSASSQEIVLPANSGGAAAGRKPRVLILPNVASWIVGQMAMQIIRCFGERYEFWFLTDKMITLRPDLVRALLPAMDFVFPLTDKSFKLLRQAAGSLPLPSSIFWVHHVTSWNPSMRDAVKSATELIACTPEWKLLIEAQGFRQPVTVVRHGVDANFFRRVTPERARFGMPKNAFVVGLVGNKTSNDDAGRKGLDTLEVVAREAKCHIPNLHLCFLGLGWDKEVRQFQRLAISANYTGFIPQSCLPAFYSSVDVHLVTSRVEGGPVTVLEAMACETPVVSTRVGLVDLTIVNGKNGFSADTDDIESLVQHLCALSRSSEVRRDIGQAARASVEQRLSWDETLQQLEEPLARMEARANRSRAATSRASLNAASQLLGAVHTMDGLLWALMSWWRGLISSRVACRMALACWEGYGAGDVWRGMQLITRSSFRATSIRNTLLVRKAEETAEDRA
jgi:glycosyltransferase involved in cell wall biosynthesis